MVTKKASAGGITYLGTYQQLVERVKLNDDPKASSEIQQYPQTSATCMSTSFDNMDLLLPEHRDKEL